MTTGLSKLLNALFRLSILMIGLFGLTIGLMISFTHNYLFPQNQINATMLILLAAILFQTSKFIELSDEKPNDTEKQTLDTRLNGLINSLAEAGNAISAIEEEINSRQELVGKLERQKTIAEEAIKLSKDQVDAVSALLSVQVAKQSRRDSRIDWIKQIIFFILGVLATILLTRLGLG